VTEREASLVSVAWIAGRSVAFDPDELRGPLRRALLLLATGGDPRREPELDGRAVSALAAELDQPERRAELESALRELRDAADELLADPDLAWRALACALLAEELAES
jgi:hypothetical protein